MRAAHRTNLRIAQIAPLFESVPPKLYGGTERIVATLTEALVAQGHEVTLFASGDSLTSARHIGFGREGLRLGSCRETLAPHLVMFEKVREMSEAGEFDIVHFHNEYMHFGLARSLKTATVSTLHGRQDLPEYQALYREFSDLPLISISMQQRSPVAFANFLTTVHHGLDPSALRYTSKRGDYLAFLGRISPEKGVEHAVEIARRSGMPLKVAAKIEAVDAEYYERVRPLLEEPFVEFVGEINDREKSAFLGGAAALAFPITWPEPFGLVMIEALATGTPVIAFRNGSVPEVIRHGETGFIVDDVEGACEALNSLHRIKRESCRIEFEERFSSERMASDYVKVYRRILASREAHNEFGQQLDQQLGVASAVASGLVSGARLAPAASAIVNSVSGGMA